MLEPDWNQDRPETTVAAIQTLWEKLRVKHRQESDGAVEKLLEAFRRTHSNGGAEFASFKIEPDTDLNWFLSRNRWDEIHFPENFLKSAVVAKALSKICSNPIADTFGFEWGSAFTFSGEIAESLSNGGAYDKHEAGAGDAFVIAESFRKWLFDDRFDEIMVLRSYKAWSEYFYDIAWDATWLIVDKRQSKVSVLAKTDTD